MNWADKRIKYLGAAIFALGAVVQFLVTYKEEIGEPFAPLLFIPPELFGPIVFGIGGALFFTARRAIQEGGSTEPPSSS